MGADLDLGAIQVHHGDCREVLATMPDCSVDSVVTDPPYELGFMGKKWDASGIAYNVELWREVLRVLKPGGHLCAFGGTRTYHRMAVAIEDAGFEVRDSLHWVYGSGFPKSLDVSKVIDKQRHDRADILKVTKWIADAVKCANVSHRTILQAFGFNEGSGMVGHWTARVWGSQPAVPTLEQVPLLLDILGVGMDDVPEDIRTLLWDLNGRKGQPGENWWKREVVGQRDVPVGHSFAGPTYGGDSSSQEVDITAPFTDAAKQWEGWGTALKPAHEPIVLARKPLIGTVAANVLEHGTGALNIDGCRIATTDNFGGGAKGTSGFAEGYEHDGWTPGNSQGRWPANVIIDDYIADTEEDWPRYFYCAKPSKKERNAGLHGLPATKPVFGDDGDTYRGLSGSKNPQSNIHPTVKPLALMRYLIRLVTPPNGTVLDPFAGSGTTLMAAIMEGFHAIGIELTEEYLPIIEGRCAWAQQQPQQLSW